MSSAQSTLFNMPQSEWENLASILSIAVALLMAAALLLRLIPGRLISWTEQLFRNGATPRALWFVLLPTLSLSLNLGIAYHKFNGPPVPIIHDEFSYLLAGDTFAHGRLTNPTPAFPGHFETPQELTRPTRMSKYPPGQGLFIALGQVLTTVPIAGIWISTAAACAAIYWMLLGFVSRPWALLGGLIAVMSPALLAWSQVYWGGCVAVLGSALMVGGWGRLMRERSLHAATIMWIGVAILANSRPFEGMNVFLPLIVGLFFVRTSPARASSTFHGRNTHGTMARHWLVPGIFVMGVTAIWMGYYNFRVTGHVLRLPFAEYTRQYDVYPKFWFQPLRPTPQYGNRSQKWVHTDFEKGQYDKLRTFSGFFGIAPLRAGALLTDNLRLAALFIPIAIALSLLRDPRIRWCFISTLALLIALLCENFDLPHYSAPAYPVLLVLVIAGLQKLWNRRGFPDAMPMLTGQPPLPPSIIHQQPLQLDYHQKQNAPRRPRGQLLAIAIVIGFTSGAILCICERQSRDSQIVQQTRLVEKQPALFAGRHLIFVNYGPMTELISGFANEYVYNAADLDDSRIIWVRCFGPQADRPVADHFSGRTVWILDVGAKVELNPYLQPE